MQYPLTYSSKTAQHTVKHNKLLWLSNTYFEIMLAHAESTSITLLPKLSAMMEWAKVLTTSIDQSLPHANIAKLIMIVSLHRATSVCFWACIALCAAFVGWPTYLLDINTLDHVIRTPTTLPYCTALIAEALMISQLHLTHSAIMQQVNPDSADEVEMDSMWSRIGGNHGESILDDNTVSSLEEMLLYSKEVVTSKVLHPSFTSV